MGHKLGVVSSGDALVDDLVLFETLLDGGVHELGHFWIVSEQVEREILTLGDGYEFILVVILVSVLLILNVNEESFLCA
jgi:hypothetical protein